MGVVLKFISFSEPVFSHAKQEITPNSKDYVLKIE